MNYLKNSFLSHNEDCLRNGSVYRVTGRKKMDRFAWYINGDFMGFENELPDDLIEYPRKEAMKFLPACFR